MIIDIVLPCDDLSAALTHYKDELGFRLDVIFPADSPRVAQMSGHGISVRLEQNARTHEQQWGGGRAGMQYSDLIPDRMDGRYIASNIRIQHGGPAPDYVHHHDVRFQMIYCYKGWVKVVYEDQGPAFVMEAGDCVLQPPHIRHRVLESSDQMEVVEVSGPAEHDTFVDHDMELPIDTVDPRREFAGQRFVRHQAKFAAWTLGLYDDFETRDTGIHGATDGFASAIVMRPLGENATASMQNSGELFFLFVLQGQLSLQSDADVQVHLGTGDSYRIREGRGAVLSSCSNDLELLQVTTQA